MELSGVNIQSLATQLKEQYCTVIYALYLFRVGYLLDEGYTQ